MPYYVASSQLAAARAAAAARQQELWKKAQSNALRMDAAENAYANGDVSLAARIYASLARSRPKTQMNDTALQRLEALARESRQKLAETDRALEEYAGKMSASQWKDKRSWPADLPGTIDRAFHQYEKIVDDYSAVSTVKRELISHVAAQRRRPEYSAVLNEPEAETLLQLARQHEADDQQCCAFWIYEQASKLAPAPSARSAAARLAEMKEIPEIVAAAEQCRKLQWCHRRYKLAERLVTVKPEMARTYFEEILENSPADSEVHKAAVNHLAEMIR
jgi:hypothetical protein